MELNNGREEEPAQSAYLNKALHRTARSCAARTSLCSFWLPVSLVVHGGSAAVNRGADFVQHLVQSPLAPEQVTGPVTAHRSIKLCLLDRRTVPVSTAISRLLLAFYRIYVEFKTN